MEHTTTLSQTNHIDNIEKLKSDLEFLRRLSDKHALKHIIIDWVLNVGGAYSKANYKMQVDRIKKCIDSLEEYVVFISHEEFDKQTKKAKEEIFKAC